MTNLLITTVSRLRQRAAHCREMARSARIATGEGLAREFESSAREYEADADSLENRRTSLQ